MGLGKVHLPLVSHIINAVPTRCHPAASPALPLGLGTGRDSQWSAVLVVSQVPPHCHVILGKPLLVQTFLIYKVRIIPQPKDRDARGVPQWEAPCLPLSGNSGLRM